MLDASGAVGVVGGECLLGEDVEAGEQAGNLIAVEVVDVTASLLVEQFQRQEREHGTEGGDHLRAGIARVGDEAVEAEPGQQWHEEEDPGDAGMERAAGREVQFSSVGDFGRLWVWSVWAGVWPEGSSASVGEKKGGATPRRQSARNRLAMDFRAGSL